MSKIVVVTGSSGFIGGALSIELKKLGFKVVGLDLVNKHHITKRLDKFYQTDFKNLPNIECPLVKRSEVIIHCAGTSLVNPSIKFPAVYYHNNVAKVIELLYWCSLKEKHLIFSSSASVYKSKNKPLKETDSLFPLSPYANSKLMVESITQDFSEAYGLKATIFRFFNACGSIANEHGEEKGSSHILAKLFENPTSFTLNGNNFKTKDGTCVRDYIHIKDIVSAHILAIDKKCYGVYNLGSGRGISNKEIIEAVGVKNYKVGERREGDVDCLVADIQLAKNKLGWTPKHDINDIVKDLKLWYSSHQKG